LLEQPIVNLPEDIYICEGDPTYLLDAGEHESYLWSDGSTNRFLDVSASGSYSVTVTNSSGCSTTDFVNVSVQSLPDAYFYYEANSLEVQFVSDALNAEEHFWDFGDGIISFEENPLHTYSNKGSYFVTYTAGNGYCGESIFSESITVNSKVNIEPLTIYPNPSTGAFTLKLSPDNAIIGLIDVIISSTSGQNLFTGTYDPNAITEYQGSYFININIDSFKKGIYVVYINAANFEGQDKLILKD
jgi:PKD repeat protein